MHHCQNCQGRIPRALLIVTTGLAGAALAGCILGTVRRFDVVDVREMGATGNGIADDTEAIQRAIDRGRGQVFFPRGTYRLGRPVVIDLDRVGFTSLSGAGAARIVMAGAGPAFRFIGTHQGTASPDTVRPAVWDRQRMPVVAGLEIVGQHDEAVGIEARGTMQLTITRVNVRDALHGIHLVERNRNVIISECHLYRNRGIGVFLDQVNLHQINVSACHISYNHGGGIVSRGGNVRNLQIGTCDIEGNMSPQTPPTANVLLDSTGGTIGEVAIVGCTIQHENPSPDSANIRLIGLGRRPDIRDGHVTIADNVLSDVQINIHLRDCRGVSVTGNTCWKGFRHNLLAERSTNLVVGPNVFDRNPRYQGSGESGNGLLFLDCRDVTITGLHINGVRSQAGGLILRQCRRFNVTGCTILDSDGAGILLEDVADSQVSGCLIRDDRPESRDPVALELAAGRGNLIRGNLLGGRLEVAPGSARVEGNVREPGPASR